MSVLINLNTASLAKLKERKVLMYERICVYPVWLGKAVILYTYNIYKVLFSKQICGRWQYTDDSYKVPLESV